MSDNIYIRNRSIILPRHHSWDEGDVRLSKTSAHCDSQQSWPDVIWRGKNCSNETEAGDHRPSSLIAIYFILLIIFFNAKAEVPAWPFNIIEDSILRGFFFAVHTIISSSSLILHVVIGFLTPKSHFFCNVYFRLNPKKVLFTYKIYFNFFFPSCHQLGYVNSTFCAFSLSISLSVFNLAEKMKNKYIIVHLDVQKMFRDLESLLLCIASF